MKRIPLILFVVFISACWVKGSQAEDCANWCKKHDHGAVIALQPQGCGFSGVNCVCADNIDIIIPKDGLEE